MSVLSKMPQGCQRTKIEYLAKAMDNIGGGGGASVTPIILGQAVIDAGNTAVIQIDEGSVAMGPMTQLYTTPDNLVTPKPVFDLSTVLTTLANNHPSGLVMLNVSAKFFPDADFIAGNDTQLRIQIGQGDDLVQMFNGGSGAEVELNGTSQISMGIPLDANYTDGLVKVAILKGGVEQSLLGWMLLIVTVLSVDGFGEWD